MPAPRPANRINQDTAQKLIEASADLGFARPSTQNAALSEETKPFPIVEKTESTPKPAAPKAEKPVAKPKSVEPKTATSDSVNPGSFAAVQARRDAKKAAQAALKLAPQPEIMTVAGQAIRLDVPDDVWMALKLDSVHRRVTVRYLILEALQKAGYPVILDQIPEDGRRLRA